MGANGEPSPIPPASIARIPCDRLSADAILPVPGLRTAPRPTSEPLLRDPAEARERGETDVVEEAPPAGRVAGTVPAGP